ncbi:hypothetical protein ACFSSA_03650 [Luteolibacter algae]|uniref:DUF4034 domain-containing protein n=1 Tax=Luteolibacter algae TaxID=454151 RepID=A0ABW5D4X5_9BACT
MKDILRIASRLTLCATLILGASCDKITSTAEKILNERETATSRRTLEKGTPGPIEHIDTAERIEAAKLITTEDPANHEIRIFTAEIRGAFDEGKFDQLEKIAAELRNSRALFPNGSWKSKVFYDALDNRFNQGEDFWLTDFKTYEAWEKAFPNSLTRRIGLINMLTEYAWHARGNGYASDVTRENHRLFQERLAMAAEIFGETRNHPDKDACCQLAAMTVALGQGWPKKDFQTLTKEALAIDPTFWHIYPSHCYAMLPRWYGEEGEWEKIALEAANAPGGLGDEVYARIVINLSSYYGNIFRESRALWPRTRDGLAILSKKYPTSLEFPSQTARLATMGNDRALAKASFDQIGEKYLESVWKKPERLVHFRTWAETGKW